MGQAYGKQTQPCTSIDGNVGNSVRLSVIIPALNESASIAAALASVRSAVVAPVDVVVVDGGSTDDTVHIAQQNGAQVIRAERGRGRQLNAGWRSARGEWCLFLHSDSQLPPQYDLRIAASLSRVQLLQQHHHHHYHHHHHHQQQQQQQQQQQRREHPQHGHQHGWACPARWAARRLVEPPSGPPSNPCGPLPPPSLLPAAGAASPSESAVASATLIATSDLLIAAAGSSFSSSSSVAKNTAGNASQACDQCPKQDLLPTGPRSAFIAPSCRPSTCDTGTSLDTGAGRGLRCDCGRNVASGGGGGGNGVVPRTELTWDGSGGGGYSGRRRRRLWGAAWGCRTGARGAGGGEGSGAAGSAVAVSLPLLPPPQPTWGAFATIQTDLRSPVLRTLLSVGVELRTRLLHRPYGDQALFVRRDVLEACGGFAEWPLLEDLELVQRLARAQAPAIVDAAVTTSGRRWQSVGFLWTTLINQGILLGYALGIPTETLARWYRGARRATVLGCHNP